MIPLLRRLGLPFRLSAAAFLLGIIAALAPSISAQLAPPQFHPERVLVMPRLDRAADTAQFHLKKGRKVLRRYPAFRNLEVVQLLPGEEVAAAIREYQASGAVEFAEPDYILRKSIVPNDPRYISQWHLNNTSGGGGDSDIDAPEGWNIRREATNIIVAILDSGLRLTHEDISPNLWRNTQEIAGNGVDDDRNGYIDDLNGINSITGSGNPGDDEGHGTHVAGIIGAAGNNGKGGSGVAWKVQLMPLKFLGTDGTGLTSDAVECVNYAVKYGAKVINASFGSPSFSSSLQSAIQAARTAGVVFVAAAGNDSTDNDVSPSYPASYSLDNVVAVAATQNQNLFDTSYSNFGATSVDLGAPGANIYSCGFASDTSYVYLSGTSMAAPVVSGVVALMRAQFPNDSPAQIVQRLLATVEPIPSLSGRCVSGGKVNLQRALSPFVSAAFTPSALAGTFPMTVRFTNQSLGEILSYTWDFGDGAPTSPDASPTHLFATEGVYTVKLTARSLTGTLSSKTQVITVLPAYSAKSVAFSWIDPTAMTRLPLTDNGVSSAQTLPFPFNFYGQPKTQLYIGANGLIGFDPANLETTSNTDLPTAATPNGLILPYWDNLNPSSIGAVYVGSIGSPPNRRAVISWVGVARNSSSDRMTFQAVLSETTGQIQFNYQEVNPGSARGGGARATIGLEDPSGVVATKYCYDGVPNRVANGQSIAFVSGGSGGISVTPEDPPSLAGTTADLADTLVSFTIRNTAKVPTLWSAGTPAPWLTLSATEGVLPPQGSVEISARVNSAVANLPPGTHSASIAFVNANNDRGNTQRLVTLEINAPVLAARLSAPTLVNGVFHLEIPGPLGQVFVILASPDLVEWIEVDRGAIGPSGVVPFTDRGATVGKRFFRAEVLP